MSALVIDASIAFKWLVAETGSEEAEALLLDTSRLYAPELILAEVGNALWKAVQRGYAHADQVGEGLDRIAAVVELAPLRTLAGRAAEIALALNHPMYDCFYLALAERESCEVATADERLRAAVARTPYAHLVGKRSFNG